MIFWGTFPTSAHANDSCLRVEIGERGNGSESQLLLRMRCYEEYYTCPNDTARFVLDSDAKDGILSVNFA